MQEGAERSRAMLAELRSDPRLARQLRMTPVQTIRELPFLSLAEKTALVRLGRDVLSGWEDASGCACGGSCGGCAGATAAKGGCSGGCGGGCAGKHTDHARAKAPRREVCAKCKGLREDCVCAELAETAWAWEPLGASVPMHVLEARAREARRTDAGDRALERHAPRVGGRSSGNVGVRSGMGAGLQGTVRAPDALAAHELRVWEGSRLLFAASAQPNAAAPAWSWGESEVWGPHGPTWIWGLRYDNGFPIHAELAGPSWNPPSAADAAMPVEAQLFARDPEELARTLTAGPMPSPAAVRAQLLTPSIARTEGTDVTLPAVRVLAFPGIQPSGASWQPSAQPIEAKPLHPDEFFGSGQWPTGNANRAYGGSVQSVRLVRPTSPGGCAVSVPFSSVVGAGGGSTLLGPLGAITDLCQDAIVGVRRAAIPMAAIVPLVRHDPHADRLDSRPGLFVYAQVHLMQGALLGGCDMLVRQEYEWRVPDGFLRLVPIGAPEILATQTSEGGPQLGGLCGGTNLLQVLKSLTAVIASGWLQFLGLAVPFDGSILGLSPWQTAAILGSAKLQDAILEYGMYARGAVALIRSFLSEGIPLGVEQLVDDVQWQPTWDPPKANIGLDVKPIPPGALPVSARPWCSDDVNDPCSAFRTFIDTGLNTRADPRTGQMLTSSPMQLGRLARLRAVLNGVTWRCRSSAAWGTSSASPGQMCQFPVHVRRVVAQPDGIDLVLWDDEEDYFDTTAGLVDVISGGALSARCRLPRLALSPSALAPHVYGSMRPMQSASPPPLSARPSLREIPVFQIAQQGCVESKWCIEDLQYWLGSDLVGELLRRGWLTSGEQGGGWGGQVPVPVAPFRGCCSGRWVDYAVCKGWLPFPPPF